MTPILQAILQHLKQDLSTLYGDHLKSITLFGSQARGDHTSDSDIDVLIVLQSMTNPGEEIKSPEKPSRCKTSAC